MEEARPKRLTLGRDKRIKYGRDFKRIRELGSRVVGETMILNWLLVPESPNSRVGIVVSRKLGSAVKRNRIKRLLREVFRIHQYEIKGPADIVMIARPPIVGKSFREIEAEFLALLAKAGLYGSASETQ